MPFIRLALIAAVLTSLAADEAVNAVECVTDSGDEGVCVKYHQCNVNPQSIIEDGYSIIKGREGTACLNFLEICCARTQIKTVTTAADHGNAESLSSYAQLKCGVGNPSVNVFKARDGDTSDRVYADFGEFPWIVAILKRNQNGDEEDFIGEGSLIHPSVVITVAHRMIQKNPEDLKIRAGEWDSNSADEEYVYQERNVAKIILHNNYNPAESHSGFFRHTSTKHHYNAALLILKNPINFANAPHIGVGCLASQIPDPGTSCFTIGWGAENFNNKHVIASILRKVKLPLVSNDDCTRRVRVECLGAPFHLHQSHTCAGVDPEVNTCLGEGGSSLICPIDDKGTRFAIVGMVSHQVLCARGNVSCIYVSMPSVYGWVVEEMSAEGFDTSFFVYN